MMRRNEKDFMLRRDQKYVAEIKKSAAEFSKALSAVAIAPPVVAEITAKLATYQKSLRPGPRQPSKPPLTTPA